MTTPALVWLRSPRGLEPQIWRVERPGDPEPVARHPLTDYEATLSIDELAERYPRPVERSE